MREVVHQEKLSSYWIGNMQNLMYFSSGMFLFAYRTLSAERSLAKPITLQKWGETGAMQSALRTVGLGLDPAKTSRPFRSLYLDTWLSASVHQRISQTV